jgi:hypothetical protein
VRNVADVLARGDVVLAAAGVTADCLVALAGVADDDGDVPGGVVLGGLDNDEGVVDVVQVVEVVAVLAVDAVIGVGHGSFEGH